MSDTRSVVITLKTEANGVSTGGENVNTSNQTSSSSVANKNDNNSNNKAIATWAGIQIATTALNEMAAWSDYYWNKSLVLNDDYIALRNKQIATTQINRGINFVSSVVSNTAQGVMMGGVVGAIVGFAIGTATQIAGIARSNIQGKEQQEIQIHQMTAQLEFTRSRAGWSLNAASIGEDL